MKRRILSLVLMLCILLPLFPLSAIAVTVDGLYYNSPYARDVVFGEVPVTSWYTSHGGDLYTKKNFGINTRYKEYMIEFDKMVGFGDLIVDGGTVESNGYDAWDWYWDIPKNVTKAMNITSVGGYITRQVMGKACQSIDTIYDWVDPADATPGVSLATRPTQYLYAYYLDPTAEEGYVGPQNLPKLIIATGNQSDEKGAIFGTYFFINDLLYNYEGDPVLEYLRHNVKLIVVPCLSPGGINQNTYWNANLVNINRNFDDQFSATVTGGYNYNASGELVLTPGGKYNADGTSASDSRYQNAGYAAFDQSEACALRDLIFANMDAFYYVDFHTNTSGPLKEGDWKNVNWQSVGNQKDDYGRQVVAAATWHINRLSANFYKEYNLAEYGVTEGQLLGNITQGDGKGTSRQWVCAQNMLGTTLEGISGWPGGILGGRYSPSCQKADCENLGNWLIAVLGQYAYNGEYPSETFSTVFAPMTGNFPTIGGLPISAGSYDTTGFAQLSPGNEYVLDPVQYPLTYHGNWTVGYQAINDDASLIGDGNFTPYTQVWRYSGSGRPLYLTDSNAQWAKNGGLRGDVPHGSTENHLITSWGSATGWNAATVVRYTAEYDGMITAEASDLVFYSNTAVILIMKNGEEIGRIHATPASSQHVWDVTHNAWMKNNKMVTLDGSFTTTVQAGDHIDFVNYVDTSIRDIDSVNGTHEIMRRGAMNYRFAVSYYSAEKEPTRRVQFTTAGEVRDSLLAAMGDPIADILAAYRAENPDYAKDGCYVNGIWYAAGTALPEVFAENVVIDDFYMETTAYISLGETYSILVDLPAMEGAIAAGVTVYGSDYPAAQLSDGSFAVELANLCLRDIPHTKMSYTPYYVLEDGTVRTATRAVSVRAEELVRHYLTGAYGEAAKNRAQALLDYIEMAEAYLADEKASAATRSRLADYDDAIRADVAIADLNTANGALYTFHAVTLQIDEDGLNFVLAIKAQDGQNVVNFADSGYTLTVNGEPVATDVLLNNGIGGTRVKLALAPGVAEGKVNETQTFCLVDAGGNAVATLSYSVRDYCIRAFEDAKGQEKYMMRAIYALALAAEAYGR